jgi:TonB family protein
MKSRILILAAALLGGVVSTSAIAAPSSDTSAAKRTKSAIEAPTLAKMVSPTGLSPRYEGDTITLSMVIDAQGQPSAIRVVGNSDRALLQSLQSAVSQWQFTPAKRDGMPVSTHVILPIELVDGPNT